MVMAGSASKLPVPSINRAMSRDLMMEEYNDTYKELEASPPGMHQPVTF